MKSTHWKSLVLTASLMASLCACGDNAQTLDGGSDCDFNPRNIVNIREDGILDSIWECKFDGEIVEFIFRYDGSGYLSTPEEDYSFRWEATDCGTIAYTASQDQKEVFSSVATHLHSGNDILSFTDVSGGDSVGVICTLRK